MIDKNELRLGNYVEYDKRVFCIYLLEAAFPCLNTPEFGIGVVKYDDLQPVVLTPDLLQRMDFRHSASGQYSLWIEGTYLDIIINSGKVFLGTTAFKTKRILFLHQLQNFIYELSGQTVDPWK